MFVTVVYEIYYPRFRVYKNKIRRQSIRGPKIIILITINCHIILVNIRMTDVVDIYLVKRN